MRPASAPCLRLFCVLSVLAIVTNFADFALAQTSRSRRKPAHATHLAGDTSAVRPATRSALPPASTDTWIGSGGNANWSNGTNWNNGAITSGENILINLTTAATTDDASFTIGSLTLSNAGDSVTINPVTLTVQGGISNAGTISVSNGGALNVTGNISGAGTINLNAIGSLSELVISSNVTLSGGTLTMSNSANNLIFGSTALNQLNNQETIQGSGHIGNGQMSLVNSGTINSNGSAGMIVDVNDGLTNTGTIEATSGSTLQLASSNVVNTGGTISANGSILQINSSTINGGNVTLTGASQLQLTSATIVGGTITNSATGTISLVSGASTLGGTINNSAGGIISVSNGTVLNLMGGTYGQLGAVQLNSTGSLTELVLQGNVTLSGGSLTLSNNVSNYIFGQVTTDTLTNAETISGAGHIGNGQLTLTNTGTINSNQSAGIVIQATGGVTNTGTLEATNGSTLTLTSTNVNNTGGTLSANASTLSLSTTSVTGGNVTLTGASTLTVASSTIHGGTLTNSATGTVNFASGTSVLGGTVNNSAGGLVEVSNGAILQLEGGTYSQLGQLQLNSSGSFSELVLEGNVTLSGGTITLSNNANNYIFGQSATDTLTNQETISGAGHIGNGSLTLINSGTINANQSAGLIIQANGGAINTGTLEATNGATLTLTSTNVNNAGGTIAANAGTVAVTSSNINGGNITLTGASTLQVSSSVVNVGSLTNSATGTVNFISGTNVLGGTVNNSAGGLLEVSNGAILDLEGGTYAQLGTVQLNSTGSFTELVLNGNVTLSGGSVTLSNNTNNYIFGQIGADTLTNQETISGAGHIGNGQLTLVNSGTINSNQSAGMIIQANGGITNTGTIETTNGATLLITSSGVINNTGGTLAANTGTLQVTNSIISGGAITLTGASSLQLTGAIITNANVTNSATGSIQVLSGTNTLGGTINNSAGGILSVANGAVLNLQGGTYTQLGAVQLNSSGSFTELVIAGNVTLSGGTLTLSNNANNYIFGEVATDTLTNQETITGAGHIGNGQMSLVNTGTINASQSAGLVIQTPNTVNTGTLEATGGAALTITSSTVNNAGGTIAANTGTIQLTNSTVNSGNITLTGASTLQMSSSVFHGGGTLTNSSTGTVEIVSGTNLLGGTLNNSAGGLVKIDNGAILDLDNGNYSQLGAVQLNSSGSFTELVIEGNVTLSGGSVTMSSNANNYIISAQPFDVLTNNETIQGVGNIGNGQMGLVNSGTINANASGSIVINVSNLNFNNTGTVEAQGGTLTIQGPGVTFLTNDNQSTNTLTGGTFIANGTNIQWNAGSGGIVTLASNVTEQAGGQLINTFNNSNMLAGLNSITATGSLTIGGVAFTDAGAFSNAGSLTLLGGESFSVGSLTQIAGNTLTAGTYVLNANLNLTGATAQSITTNAATITLAGGTIKNTTDGSNALAALATNSGKLTIGGSSNNLSTTASTFSNTGTLVINATDSYTAGSLAQVSGTTLSAGTFTLSGNLNLTSGTSITTNAATLTLSGGSIVNGATNLLSALASNTKTLTIGGTGNNVLTTAASFSNTGKLTINAGDSFTAPKLTQISGSTLSGGTYVLGGNLNLTTATSVTTNSATLTLQGGSIMTGATNDLANLASNTKSLTVTGTTFTTGASFTNSGTLTVSTGSTFGVSGTNTFTQTAGTTTVDGTLAAGGGTGVSLTGGTLLGAGSITGAVSNGAAISVGDTGKAGLLAITGAYTQLSTGTLNVSIGGTAVGTQYDQLKITGTASLGGTLSASLLGTFTPTIGQTFTILKASSVSGTFTNTTIAINSSEHFAISYTSTGVVLTVTAGPVSGSSNPLQPAMQLAAAAPKNTLSKLKMAFATNKLQHSIGVVRPVSGVAKPVVLAAFKSGGYLPAAPRVWEHIPVAPTWNHVKDVSISNLSRPVTSPRSGVVLANTHPLPVRMPLAGGNKWSGVSSQQMPVRGLPVLLPKLR